MAFVCAGLRDRCSMDTLWERHIQGKWSRVLTRAARKEWGAELGARAAAAVLPRPTRRRSWADSLACAWPFSWIGCRWIKPGTAAPAPATHPPSAPPADTVAAWYRALECCEFWFPAQVYNREHWMCALAMLFLQILFYPLLPAETWWSFLVVSFWCDL